MLGKQFLDLCLQRLQRRVFDGDRRGVGLFPPARLRCRLGTLCGIALRSQVGRLLIGRYPRAASGLPSRLLRPAKRVGVHARVSRARLRRPDPPHPRPPAWAPRPRVAARLHPQAADPSAQEQRRC